MTNVKKTKELPVQTCSSLGSGEANPLEKELSRQKKEIERLREIVELQNIVLEKSPSGYYIVQGGTFKLMNSVALSFTGYSPGELIGKKADFLIHPDDKKSVKKIARDMLLGENRSPYEFRIRTKTGGIRWVLDAIVPILFQGKRAILGTSMDISRQKLLEQKMTESENLYRTIFETTGSMTMIGDEYKRISLVNAEFEKLTGFRREDWEGKKSWTEYTHPDDLPRMVEYFRMRRIHPDAVPKAYESRLIDSQGKIKHILVNVNMIPGTKKHVSTAIDITELKETEKQLIRKSESLLELNTALKVLLDQRENDRKNLETTFLSNVREFVLPCIEKIRKKSPDKRLQTYIDLLESNLNHILTPFSRTLSAKYMCLTSTEIKVADLVKEGKNSKEIAELLNITGNCVDIHRYHIRKKLGLAKRSNLEAFLKNIPS